MIEVGAPVERTCRRCLQTFVIDTAEQQHLADIAARTGLAFFLPKECVLCRRRSAPVAAQGPPLVIACITCGKPIQFAARDRKLYAARGWVLPRRCKGCRPVSREREWTI